MRYAKIHEGRVAELIELPEGKSPQECFHPAFAAAMVPDPAGEAVEGGTVDGASFGPRPADPGPSPEEQRRRAYPSDEEQHEALWDLVALLRDQGLPLGPRALAALGKVEAARAAYPDPERGEER